MDVYETGNQNNRILVILKPVLE